MRCRLRVGLDPQGSDNGGRVLMLLQDKGMLKLKPKDGVQADR